MTLPEPRILHFTRWLARERGLQFDPTNHEGYDALWRWSVSDLPAFWSALWDYFELQSPTPYRAVLDEEVMPGARWFDGAQLNYAQQVFRHADAAHAAGHPAIVFQNEAMAERGELQHIAWPQLRQQVASLAAALRGMGVQPGDRVAAILPTTPQAAIAFLAVASVGAVWSVCSPDMGPVAVLDRFRQIEPKVLIACDGYRYAGVVHDRLPLLHRLLGELPSVRDVVLWRQLSSTAGHGDALRWHDFTQLTADTHALLTPTWLPFEHPLWVVYSSGTTGLPKPIVHGHGGVMLEALKLMQLHNDIGPSIETGDRFHWYSSTGWIMWNCQMSGLLGGTTICLFDGSPGGRQGAPDWATLWRFAGASGATFFGAGAAFYASCLKAGVAPTRVADLSRLRAVGSTGSPLAAECYRWAWEQLPKVDGRDIWLTSISGGTDFAGGFIAGLRTLPVTEGEMQCRCLGAAVQAWSEPDGNGRGHPLIDEVGELVCTKPMPSMPLYFWNDPGGRRYHDSYFDMYPGVWRHGDWLRITPRGGAIIYGRSDATINRHGIRMGTSELYRAVEALPEVLDSLVVDLEYLGRESYMPLFVVLREGLTLDDALSQRLKAAIREALSARHVPNEIFQVQAIPRTLSGKKMELPVKKLLLGQPAEKVLNADAMANADSVAWFAQFAQRRSHA
ncbi:acetoacetyl-CoA synthetase [Burkholderiaceae bacterium]|nr:acetoacetyl-CoA synthetase [Burkholderiaceae bacterium]